MYKTKTKNGIVPNCNQWSELDFDGSDCFIMYIGFEKILVYA